MPRVIQSQAFTSPAIKQALSSELSHTKMPTAFLPTKQQHVHSFTAVFLHYKQNFWKPITIGDISRFKIPTLVRDNYDIPLPTTTTMKYYRCWTQWPLQYKRIRGRRLGRLVIFWRIFPLHFSRFSWFHKNKEHQTYMSMVDDMCIVCRFHCRINAITFICLFVDAAKAAQADGDGYARDEIVVSHERNSNPQQLKYANAYVCIYTYMGACESPRRNVNIVSPYGC